ncbi:hypothetical protein PG990_007900 [Apiospora arundinis]
MEANKGPRRGEDSFLAYLLFWIANLLEKNLEHRQQDPVNDQERIVKRWNSLVSRKGHFYLILGLSAALDCYQEVESLSEEIRGDPDHDSYLANAGEAHKAHHNKWKKIRLLGEYMTPLINEYGKGALVIIPWTEIIAALGGGDVMKVLNRGFFGTLKQLISLSTYHKDFFRVACATVEEPTLRVWSIFQFKENGPENRQAPINETIMSIKIATIRFTLIPFTSGRRQLDPPGYIIEPADYDLINQDPWLAFRICLPMGVSYGIGKYDRYYVKPTVIDCLKPGGYLDRDAVVGLIALQAVGGWRITDPDIFNGEYEGKFWQPEPMATKYIIPIRLDHKASHNHVMDAWVLVRMELKDNLQGDQPLLNVTVINPMEDRKAKDTVAARL